MIERTQPQATDDEARLISCVFIDGETSFSKAINAGITGSSFYTPEHSDTWQIFDALFTAGTPINEESFASKALASGQIESIGGYAAIARLSGVVPTTNGVEQYIAHIRQAEVRRAVIREASRMVEVCHTQGDEDTAASIEPSLSRIMQLTTGLKADKEMSWNEAVAKAEVDLDEIIAGDNASKTAIQFPWERMNKLFAPMRKGQLVVLAARPSVGKSSLARPIALHAAKHGHKVYFVTLEVSPERVPLQMASTLASVGLRDVATSHAKDQQTLRNAIKSLLNLGVTISRRDRSISRITSRARALKAQGKLDLLIIDHGLLVEEVGQSKTMDAVGAISRLTKALKILAGELDICCLLLWQLNRGSEKDDNREPNLSDLRGSGSLEEDADKVLFIHRPNTSPDGIEQKTSTTADEQPTWVQNVIQAKGRDDGTSLMSMQFKRATATFTPIDIRAHY